MTAVGQPAVPAAGLRVSRRSVVAIIAIAAVVLWVVFRGQMNLPHDDDYGLFNWLNGLREWVRENRTILDAVRAGIAALVTAFDEILASLGWPGVIGLAAAIGYAFSGWRLTILAVTGFAILGVLELWDASMAVLSMMLAAVLLALTIGLPLGILAGRSERVSAFLSPILDFMQIMPTLAYLTPMTLLFLIGVAPSTVATLIFAIPAAIRITSLGIKGVSATTLEAARSLGATEGQLLTKVTLPLARRPIGLAVNQTIMLALSMVVITALIGAPGLGLILAQALRKVNVGEAFDAGIAIVILAIILDRLTYAAVEWMDPRERSGQRRRGGRSLTIVIVVGLLLIGLAAPMLIDATEFPDAITFSFAGAVNAIVTWFTDTFRIITIGFKDLITAVVLNPLETILTDAPFWLTVGLGTLIAYAVSGRRAAIVVFLSMAMIIALGLWSHAMATLANVVVGTLLTLAIGLVIGILTARHDRLRTALRPFLDAAQTLPAFVYLIPALALFEPTRFTAIVAAIIYALPPVIRLVDVGIRGVPQSVVEASTASGATSWQLLYKVQLPMSRRALLLAANQGIVMVLSMVVIGALVGAGALGYDVLQGFARGEHFGKSLAAGLAIVLLGILLDRITQGAGGNRRAGMEGAG
ncbi:MAG TPA: ABC transporter permease subunit [Candidatus Limnocylindrales bacterium]|nr:ABC transporter permease subunit [Candidatus Limnocylindrales bacterium]